LWHTHFSLVSHPVMTVISVHDECVTELPHRDPSFCNQAKGHKLGVTVQSPLCSWWAPCD
jgi:hypothetical protein